MSKMNNNDNKKGALEKSLIDQVPEEYYVGSGFYKGMMYAIFLSIPLWLSFIGWIKIIRSLFSLFF